MKVYALALGLFAVLALSAGATRSSYALDDGVLTMTCSGDYAVYGAQNFYFGYTDREGNCGIQSYYANSPGEAYSCAVKVCNECSRLQDLTGLYQSWSAMPGYNPGEQYCLGK